MGRKSLARDQGMLFIYDSEVLPEFWMKNMQMKLDIVWLDRKGKTVAIHEQVPACVEKQCPSFKSRVPVLYVLELPAGAVKEKGIRLGDQANIAAGVL